MKIIVVFLAVITATSAIQVSQITGTTPPPINCPNKLCHGRYNGNFEILTEPNYFVQCVSGLAYCQPCWPLHLVFSERCNQCLFNKDDECSTTQAFAPATTFECPFECEKITPPFTGNLPDPRNRRQYVACWEGFTVGCVACPGRLVFNKRWNACVKEGGIKDIL